MNAWDYDELDDVSQALWDEFGLVPTRATVVGLYDEGSTVERRWGARYEGRTVIVEGHRSLRGHCGFDVSIEGEGVVFAGLDWNGLLVKLESVCC
jgi:hypothetical protein